LKRIEHLDHCVRIFNSCWAKMSNTEADWDRAIEFFSKVCKDSGNDPQVTALALQFVEILEAKFKEEEAAAG